MQTHVGLNQKASGRARDWRVSRTRGEIALFHQGAEGSPSVELASQLDPLEGVAAAALKYAMSTACSGSQANGVCRGGSNAHVKEE